MTRRAPATGIVVLAVALIASLAAAALPAPTPTAHADAPTYRLYLPIVQVHPPPSPARTLHVPADHPTIAAALAVARAGDVVELAEGSYHETGLRVPDGVTLRGAGWRRTSIWRSTAGVDPAPDPMPDPMPDHMPDPMPDPMLHRLLERIPAAMSGRAALASAAGLGPVAVTLGEDAAIEGLEVGADEEDSTGIFVDGPGRHSVRDVKFTQLGIGIYGGCEVVDDACVAVLDVSRSLFEHCETAVIALPSTLLIVDHATIRFGDTGVIVRRVGSRVTNTIFDGTTIGLDFGPIAADGGVVPGVQAHHNLFSRVEQPNRTWLEPGEGDIHAAALIAPFDVWLTPRSPARHAASDGSDIGAIPFAGIGAPPARLRAERGFEPSPEAPRQWVVTWDSVPDAWMYHVVASPADGGPPSLGYDDAETRWHGGGPMVVLSWLDPHRAYRVAVSTAYFERGDSEASEEVLLPAGGGP